MSSSVKRACDACHRRKVKCDGVNPCRNCSSAQLSCTYHAIPQKKGPKGSRAKVISELRETQRQTTLSSKVAGRLSGLTTSPCSPALAPTPGLLTSEMIRDCTDFFFAHMYPTLPILHRARLEQQSLYADQNVDTYCLLTAMCAFMMIQPGMPIPGEQNGLDSMPGANLISGNVLLEEALRVRKGYDHLETPTMNSLVTSFFLFGCYFGLDLHNKAWFHLREATTLVHILGLHQEETYRQFDQAESSRRRRLYWLLFVTERAYALQRHRPLSLQATIAVPTEHDDPSDTQAHHLHGFLHLVNLFRPFDDAFVALWNKTRSDCSPAYLAALQKQLTDALPTYLNSTENQTADLQSSQQWLRTMVWQMSMQNGYLSTGCEDPSMSFQYPVDISRDLLSMTSQFSHQSMEVHGLGLIEKLFDVACSLTDVLSLLPSNPQPFTLGPRDYLHQFTTLLSVLRNGDHRFLPLLLSKVHDVLPTLVNPMLQSVPDTVPEQMCAEVDIFDGFGAMGMTVASFMHSSPSQPEFKIETPFDHRIEEITSPVHRPETNDHSPFSPAIVSPSVEFPGVDYRQYPDLSGPGMGGGYDNGVGGRQVDFKVEFEGSLGMNSNNVGPIRRPSMIRHGSVSSYGLASPASVQIPRSIPEQQFHHQQLHRSNSGGEVDAQSDSFR